jgi:hypothetical protein
MFTDQLAYAFLTHDYHDVLTRNRRRLTEMVALMPEYVDRGGTTFRDTLKAIVLFDQERGKCPTVETLKQFLLTIDNSTHKGLEESVHVELEPLVEMFEETPPEVTDIELLVDESLKQVRSSYWEISYGNAINITVSGVPTKNGGLLKGPDDAMRYLAERRSKDLISESNLSAGFLHENADLVQANFETALSTENTGRFKLGFDQIDRNVLIGTGSNMNRFIGLLGQSGDGKSTTLHSIVYNLISQGATVLYNSTEHDPEELWEIMAFLCYERYMDTMALPARYVWDMARGGDEECRKQITTKHIENMRIITNGLKNRALVPGTVDCQRFTTMPEILDHMSTHDRKYHYDVLAIDYLGSLSVGCDLKLEVAARKEMIVNCQTLTRTWNNGKGLVVISPIQVNRDGKKAADKAEAGERRYQRDAIRDYSEYCHYMDFIFSVYSSDVMRVDCQIELDVVKAPRKGRAPMVDIATLDRRTGKVATLTAAQLIQMQGI